MRIHSLLVLILFSAVPLFSQNDDEPWARPKDSDYPKIAAFAAKCDEFMPKGWKTVSAASGDLNGDKRADCAIIFQGTDKRFVYRNDGLGEELFDTNPRILVVAFAEQGGYRLVDQSNTFVISAQSPMMTEPFQEISIKKGLLKFLFEEFYSAGSYGMGNLTYTFRFQNGEMTLIGVDKTSMMRSTGELEIRSYNLSTGQMTIETGHISDDGKGKIRRRAFRVRPLPTLKTVKPMFTWEIEKDIIL